MNVSERVRSASELKQKKQKELQEIEDVAVELASLAGAEITRTLGSIFTVRDKTGPQGAEISLRDPVSEVDGLIESLIGERFPDHAIIGEEMQDRLGYQDTYLWAVDPIDGTTNFVNSFPLFAASIGVRALWCSISHALRAGVYHAHDGGPLRFESDEVTPRVNPEVRRKLAGVPVALPSDSAHGSRKLTLESTPRSEWAAPYTHSHERFC